MRILTEKERDWVSRIRNQHLKFARPRCWNYWWDRLNGTKVGVKPRFTKVSKSVRDVRNWTRDRYLQIVRRVPKKDKRLVWDGQTHSFVVKQATGNKANNAKACERQEATCIGSALLSIFGVAVLLHYAHLRPGLSAAVEQYLIDAAGRQNVRSSYNIWHCPLFTVMKVGRPTGYSWLYRFLK
jgi:hypothetical protein